jgi:hypothetical protein
MTRKMSPSSNDGQGSGREGTRTTGSPHSVRGEDTAGTGEGIL